MDKMRRSASAGNQYQSMTFWSRHDPAISPVTQTDHWAKLRIKSALPAARGCRHTGYLPAVNTEQRRDPVKEEFQARMKQLQANGDGRYDTKGVAVFSQVVARDLHGNIPGNYTLVRPKTTPTRSSLRSSYNEKARQGYKYWYQERPKPTSFGRYGIGSYKTVLGLGNGPRS